MIPHPLTLLFCWLIGRGLADALGYALQFAGELCADAVRYGWAGPSFFGVALLVLGGASAFATGAFVGAATRLLAEPSWPKAAGWAILLCALAAAIGSPAPVRLYAALTPCGCLLGAWSCDRGRGRPGLDAAEAFLRGWMFWERGGAAGGR